MAQGLIGTSGRAFTPVKISAPRLQQLPHSFMSTISTEEEDEDDTKMDNIADLVAEMDVDQSVRPVDHTVGGSTAGYTRWRGWLAAGGIKTYLLRGICMSSQNPTNLPLFLVRCMTYIYSPEVAKQCDQIF